MVVKVFVLGLPGSGKSAAIRHLDTLARDCQWVVDCINDYDILYEMFEADSEGLLFKSTDYGGFDVIDLTAFDIALQKVERRITRLERQWVSIKNNRKKIVFIEFARNDYCQALKQFTAPFLKDAFFIFVKATIPVCKHRVQERVKRRQNEEDHDNHFVSDYIFETYYNQDIGENRILELNEAVDFRRVPYIIREECIQVVNNALETSFEGLQHHLQSVWTRVIQYNESKVSVGK